MEIPLRTLGFGGRVFFGAWAMLKPGISAGLKNGEKSEVLLGGGREICRNETSTASAGRLVAEVGSVPLGRHVLGCIELPSTSDRLCSVFPLCHPFFPLKFLCADPDGGRLERGDVPRHRVTGWCPLGDVLLHLLHRPDVVW